MKRLFHGRKEMREVNIAIKVLERVLVPVQEEIARLRVAHTVLLESKLDQEPAAPADRLSR